MCNYFGWNSQDALVLINNTLSDIQQLLMSQNHIFKSSVFLVENFRGVFHCLDFISFPESLIPHFLCII